jgi:superoxide dismutase
MNAALAATAVEVDSGLQSDLSSDVALSLGLLQLLKGVVVAGALSKAIDSTYGSLGEFQSKMNAALAGIQGSGWACVNTEQRLELADDGVLVLVRS